MGIDFSSGNIRMAEHALYSPQIGPALEQMGSKTVAKQMGIDGLADTGSAGILLEALPNPLPAQRRAF